MAVSRPRLRALIWASSLTLGLAVLIVLGSQRLAHFDAALVSYTFATLFAVFGITWRYTMWLQRPPTRMYWRRGWQAFLEPRAFAARFVLFVRRLFADFGGNRFIFKRGRLRGLAHFAIMWGTLMAAAITFPLVWGWIHFEAASERLDVYRTYFFGLPMGEFAVESLLGFVIFHGLVWASILLLAGVMLAFRRRMIGGSAAALQQFGEDILPLVLLGAISVTGLMLTVSYTWMHAYAYEFLAILHAVTVIVTFLWLPFGKLFHIFQRPAQLGVRFYKDEARRSPQASCARCGREYAPAMMVRDLIEVERELGFRYEMRDGGAAHYQEVCPACRRALFGLAQTALWTRPAIPPRR